MKHLWKMLLAATLCLTLIMPYGVMAEETVYVGDSDVDVITARNAGISCVAVCWGFRPEECLQEAGAQHIAHTPDELLEMIKAL